MNERVRFIGSLSHYLVAATTFRSLINGYTRLFIWRKTNKNFHPSRVYFNTVKEEGSTSIHVYSNLSVY